MKRWYTRIFIRPDAPNEPWILAYFGFGPEGGKYSNATHEERMHWTSEEMLGFCEQVGGATAENRVYVKRAIFTLLGVLSLISLSVVAISIFTNEKLQGHPSPLIARICISEAILVWNSMLKVLRPSVFICYLHSYVLFKNMTGTSYYEAFMVLVWANELIVNFMQLVTLCLNLFLCIDLILTLQSPFEVASRRLSWYSLLSLLTPAIFVT